MKILSIGPAHPLRGGIAKFNESFALSCMKEGHDVEIVSFKFLYPGFLFPGKSQYSSDPAPKDLIIHSWLHSVNPFNWISAIRNIKKLQPDIIVFHYWMPFFAPVMGFLARRLKKKTGAKIFAVAHNLIPHEKQAFSGILTSYFVNSLDGLVCLSTSVLNDLRSINNSLPALCLPHPIYDTYGEKISKEEAKTRLNLDTKTNYLLFFGLIRKYKGLDLMLEAFAKIKMDNLVLIVAGEFYEPKAGYIELVEKLGISEKVIFTDSFVSDADVKYYFSAAEMVVQPYLTATQSGVTQIAYHFDCPMLVTNTGGLAEIVIDMKTGFVCEKDPVEIAEKIEMFFKQNMSNEMIENIKVEKGRFSWSSFVKNFFQLAQSV